MRLILAYNLRRDGISAEEAEFDSPETIEDIKGALERSGNSVRCVEENDDFFVIAGNLREETDLVFNIAEGRKGPYREAAVPFMLEMLGIPYTASDPKTLLISHDKHLCSRLVSASGVDCPASVPVSREDLGLISGLRFPVIVKPNFEGSSKGISEGCVYPSFGMLLEGLSRENGMPGSPLIAEEYVEGREFTVAALVSSDGIRVFKPMEVIFRHGGDYNIYSFEIKKTGNRYVEFDYDPQISLSAEEKMYDITKKVVSTLGVRDLARLDFRLSKDGRPYFIEINPLPGLARDYSDFPNICKAGGLGYDELIAGIVESAIERMR